MTSHAFDRAADLILDAIVVNRMVRDIGVTGLLKQAIPFQWTARTVQLAVDDATHFPKDATIQPSDLIEPVQWWVYPDVPMPNEPPSPETILATDMAILVADARLAPVPMEGVWIGRFIRMVWGTNPDRPLAPALCGCALWPYGKTFDAVMVAPAGVRTKTGLSRETTRDLTRFALEAVAGQFWLRSKAVRTDSIALSRHAKRRAKRAEATSSSVRVITMREAEPNSEALDRAAHEWACRWLVRSHWRQQYIPSTGGHRPTLISDYVKGPEDKPLRLHSDRFYKVTR